MPWRVELDVAAKREAKTLYKKHRHLVERYEDIMRTLEKDPFHPSHSYEPLKGDLSGYHSRRINMEHRVVYRVDGKKVLVFVIQCMGHY